MYKMLFVVTGLAAALAASANASPQAGNWDTLAVSNVQAGSGADQVAIRSYEQYDAIRVCSSAPIRLRDLRVSFYNGDRQDVAVSAMVPSGSCTSAIDLKGVQRSIKAVRMRFDPGQQAVLRVQAR